MTDTDLRQSMAKAARRKVVDQHQIEHDADAITAVYRRLIAEG